MASSGIEYNPDGGVGWSNSKFRQGVKSGMVNMGMSMAMSYYNVNGALAATARGFMNSGLQTDGGWTDWGFSASDWQDHLVAGAAAGAATWATSGKPGQNNDPNTAQNDKVAWADAGSNDYLQSLGYNTVSAGLLTAWNMSYHGKSWDESVAKTGLYSGATYSLGDAAGWLVKDTIEKYQAKNKPQKEQAPQSEKQEDPLEDVEMGLSGIFESLWGGLKNLGNSFGNLLSGDGFRTDKEIQADKLRGLMAANDPSAFHYGSSPGSHVMPDSATLEGLTEYEAYKKDGPGLFERIGNFFGNLFSSEKDPWQKYFGDGSYLNKSEAEQAVLWEKYVLEQKDNGVEVAEEHGNGIVKRYVAREFFDQNGRPTREGVEGLLRLTNGGRDVNLSQGFNVVMFRDFYDIDPSVSDEQRATSNAYYSPGRGADNFTDRYVIIDNGVVRFTGPGDSNASRASGNRSDGSPFAKNPYNDLSPGEYSIGHGYQHERMGP